MSIAELAHLRNRIRAEFRRSAWAARNVTVEARRHSASAYAEIITTAYASQAAGRRAVLAQRLWKATELFSSQPFKALQFRDELEWVTQQLLNNVPTISKFRAEASILAETVLDGHSNAIRTALDDVAQASGESSWLIEARIACLQATHGLDAQRKYVHEIYQTVGPTLLYPIIYFVGQRNEDLVSIKRFTARVEETVRSWALPGEIETYIMYKLLGLDRPSGDEMAQILTVSATASIVDLYETFLDIIRYAIVSGRVSELGIGKVVSSAISRMAAKIQDERLYGLAALIDPGLIANFNPTAQVDIADTFKLRTITRAARRGNTEELSPHIGPMQARCLRLLTSILHRQTSAESASQELSKLSRNFFILREAPFLRTISSYGRGSQEDAVRVVARAYFACDSKSWKLVAQTETDAIIQDLDATAGHPLALCVTGPSVSGSSFLRLEEMLASYDLEPAVNLALGIGEGGDLYDSLQLVRTWFSIFARSNQWWEAAELAARKRVDYPGFRRELPLKPILTGIPWRQLRDYESNARLSIALYMAIAEDLDTRETDLPAMMRQALRRLLKSHNAVSFASLDQEALGITQSEYVFFLRHVCVETYIIGNPYINTSKALAEERIQICQRLAAVDAQNAPQYNEEIRQLTYRLELQEGVDSFDRSRVFINRDGIRRWAKRTLTEDFMRFQTLIDMDGDSMAALQDAISKLRGNAPIPDALLRVPLSEADKLLVDMLVRLRDQYVSSPEDGLDVFLSLRVRHGSLSGNVRGPLEEEGLLTLKDEATGTYGPNKIWAERLAPAGLTEQEKVNEAFGGFSDAIDSAIQHVIRDVIQLRSREKPEGAFEIAITYPLVNLIKVDLSRTTEFDQFLDIAFATFSACMNRPLEDAKEALQDRLKSEVEAALESLRRELLELIAPRSSPALVSALGRASTNVASAIDRVADWFSPDPLTDRSRVYSVERLVQMAIQITRSTHRGFDPNMSVQVDCQFQGIQMHTGAMIVVDVVFTLLDNVFRHSGNQRSPEVALRVSMPDDRHLQFAMRNEVRAGSRTPELEARLQSLRDLIDGGSFGVNAASEGGSGFIKLKRIGMHSSTGARTQLSFGFEGDSAFEVSVAIPIRIEERGST